jgi:hypothetical protein
MTQMRFLIPICIFFYKLSFPETPVSDKYPFHRGCKTAVSMEPSGYL